MLSYLQLIIAKGLALVDGILENFTSVPAVVTGTGTGACAIGGINVVLNGCGTQLANDLATLMVQGVALLQGMITALGAGSF